MYSSHRKSPDRPVFQLSHWKGLFAFSLLAALVGLAGSVGVSVFAGEGSSRFYHVYLVNFSYFLSISLGALFFVLIHHVSRAGWSVVVRRLAESLAAIMPLFILGLLPIALSLVLHGGALYPWADESHQGAGVETAVSDVHAGDTASTVHSDHGGAYQNDDHASAHHDPIQEKRAYLNVPFFLGRCFAYLLIWSMMGVWFWRQSVRQDEAGDVSLSRRMEFRSAPAIVVYGFTVTFGAFDLLMTLSPAWYSTIFGAYFFSGSAVAGFAAIILMMMLLQRKYSLNDAVTTEHYHDLGKYLFAFVFFWGYIAFSQYVLIWYANLPETTFWFTQRGATTRAEDINAWSIVVLALLFGHLLIPFAGLLSRHVKRNRVTLAFWAGWLLVFHWIDLWWLVMPELDTQPRFGVMDVLCFVGLGGLFMAAWLRIMSGKAVIPIRDPRLHESLDLGHA